MHLDLGTILGVAVLLALVVAIYFSFPPEPAENAEARKRHGKVSKEEIQQRLDDAHWASHQK